MFYLLLVFYHKFLQVSRIFLSILAELKNSIAWMVSTHPDISNSSDLCTNQLETVPRAPIIIGMTVTFMLDISLNSPASSRYLSFSLF